MPKSMTGYGQAQGKIGDRRISVEVKSVNHKFCEINYRVSSSYTALESRAVALAKNFFRRGRIDIFVRDEHQNGMGLPVKIDIPKLKTFHQQLTRAAKSLKIPPEVDLKTLLSFPQMFLVEEEENLEKFWEGLKKLLTKAFESMEKMRQREGKAIGQFLKTQLVFTRMEIKKIEKAIPDTVKGHQTHLEDRIKKLANNIELDPIRLSQEVAYFVDRTDISEELQRLMHHIIHFEDLLKSKDPLGRKLDFLLQEMNREVNTLSAKVQNAAVSQRVVECKHALEKMREQVQNIE